MAFSRKTQNWLIVLGALLASGIIFVKFRSDIVGFTSKYSWLNPITNLLKD